MAFNLQHFQFNRGSTTSNAQGQGFTPVIHTYTSSTDTMATIAGAGYFPPFIDGDADKVFTVDLLLIVATDGTSLVNITGLDPVTLGVDLLSAGVSLSVGAPIAPVDGNALRIAANILQAQFATGVFPGIVSTAGQAFSGTKNFQTGINVFDPGITTTHLNSTGATPLELADDGLTTQVHASAPVLVDLGVSFITATPTTTLTTFHDEAVPVTWTGPFTVGQAGAIFIQQVNNLVYLTIREINTAAATNNLPITSGVVVPVGLRPTADIIGLVRIIDDSVSKVGTFDVTAAGVINIYPGLDVAPFTGTVNAGVDQPTIAYTLV